MVRLAADEDGIARAASLIRRGRLVIWPSGGVYGLATSALCSKSVRRIYQVKGRPLEKPLQIITSVEGAGELGILSPALKRVVNEVWPAYIGFVVSRKSPDLVDVAGPRDTLLLVCPNRIAADLAGAAGVPIVGTSANLSGTPEVRTPEEAEAQFVESVDAMIDGGIQSGDLNTVIDLSRRPYRVLRKGAIPAGAILAMLAEAGQK